MDLDVQLDKKEHGAKSGKGGIKNKRMVTGQFSHEEGEKKEK